MSSPARPARQKISTTVAPETLDYLEELIRKKEAGTLAEAIDLLVERLRAFENRERLEGDTAAYFANLTDEEAAEEQRLEAALSQSPAGIDVDR